MPVLDTQTPQKRGSLRGRESRNQTVTTKLTEAEYRAVFAAAGTEAKTTGEWMRDLALRAVAAQAQDSTVSVVLPEVITVRLLLVNVLRSLAAGQKVSVETFDKLLDQIGTVKHELTEKLITEGSGLAWG